MPRHSPWLNRFAIFTALTTLTLIGVGGLVTSHGVGMAVPDWPTTYGYNMFAFPFSQWIGGIFYEHTHRLVAIFVGLLTAVLAIWLWARETQGRARWTGVTVLVLVFVLMIVLMAVRKLPGFLTLAALAPPAVGVGLYRFRRDSTAIRWLGVAAFAAVILQGVLGGLRVVWFKDEIGIFHATLAQLFLVLICVVVLLTTLRWREAVAANLKVSVSRGTRQLVLATTLLILAQLVLGATMRHQHAGLAVPDFPLAYGKLWPPTDATSIDRINQQRIDARDLNAVTAAHIYLHMAHRIGALLILAAVAAVAWRVGRELGAGSRIARVAQGWFALIFFQACLGALTVLSNKAADIATLHVVLGATSMVTGGLLTTTIYKFSIAVSSPVIHARKDLSVAQVSQPGNSLTTI